MKDIFSKFVFLAVSIFLIAGCSAISQKQAEAKAMQFVGNKVKFFARQENSTLTLPQHKIDSLTSYQEGKNWVVIMHVTAIVGNDTKKNDLAVKLNAQGGIIEFNGKKVSSQQSYRKLR